MRAMLVVMLLLAVLGGASAQDEATYTVRAGDVLDVIAARFDVALNCLAQANGLENPNQLEIGQELVIPVDCPPYDGTFVFFPLPEEDGQGGGGGLMVEAYEVQAGDRLSAIAETFGADLTCLIQTNGIINPNLIFAGQIIYIMPACLVESGGGVDPGINPGGVNRVCAGDRNPGRIEQIINGQYIVQPGDTLDFIGCDLGLATQCLATVNDLPSSGGFLAIGQALVIDYSCGPWTGRDLD